MNTPKRSQLQSDILPGAVAAAAFLAMNFAFGMKLEVLPLAVSAGLSLVVYFAVKMMLPSPQAQVPQEEPTEQILERVAQLGATLPNGSLRIRVRNITDLAFALLQYGKANPEKSPESLFVVRQYLLTTRSAVYRYIETQRLTPASASQSEQAVAELLETVHSSLNHLHEQLVEKETADLRGDISAMNKTLQELNHIWLPTGERRE